MQTQDPTEERQWPGRADEIADKGKEENARPLFTKVAKWLGKRHKVCTTIMGKIQKVIIVVLKEEKRKGAEETK